VDPRSRRDRHRTDIRQTGSVWGGEEMEETLRVLVLDDEPVVGDRVKPAVEQDGYEVEVFVDPLEALKRIEETSFDIVITDIRMEGATGIEVLERVIAKKPDAKVIIITGYATMELAREAMEKMAFDFIAKPFKLAELRAIVKNAAKAIAAER
jgi:DNA-binding NtrC family response regulator